MNELGSISFEVLPILRDEDSIRTNDKEVDGPGDWLLVPFKGHLKMRSSIARGALALLSVAAITGCQSGSTWSPTWWNPFHTTSTTTSTSRMCAARRSGPRRSPRRRTAAVRPPTRTRRITVALPPLIMAQHKIPMEIRATAQPGSQYPNSVAANGTYPTSNATPSATSANPYTTSPYGTNSPYAGPASPAATAAGIQPSRTILTGRPCRVPAPIRRRRLRHAPDRVAHCRHATTPNYGTSATPNYGASTTPNYGTSATPNYGANTTPELWP